MLGQDGADRGCGVMCLEDACFFLLARCSMLRSMLAELYPLFMYTPSSIESTENMETFS